MITFDEILLDPYYSPMAKGGPTFVTSRLQTLNGDDSRGVQRYDYISKYTIKYEGMSKESVEFLRAFHILRFGEAYAFRFLAPDMNHCENEFIAQVTNGQPNYYLIQTYSDMVRSYTRRIVKPAWDDVRLVFRATNDRDSEPVATVELFQDPAHPQYGVSQYANDRFPGQITLDWTTGALALDDTSIACALANCPYMFWTGGFHLPVTFGKGADDNQMVYDLALVSTWDGLPIEEVLPAAIGIYQ